MLADFASVTAFVTFVTFAIACSQINKIVCCVKNCSPGTIFFLAATLRSLRSILCHIPDNTKSRHKVGFLCYWRERRGSNSRPHAWQACILTSWTTPPTNVLTYIQLIFKKQYFFLRNSNFFYFCGKCCFFQWITLIIFLHSKTKYFIITP